MPNIFGPAALAKAVHDSFDTATAAIPNGHTKALLIDGTYTRDDGPGVRALWVQRTSNGWNVLLEGAYNGHDGPSAGIKVARSWK